MTDRSRLRLVVLQVLVLSLMLTLGGRLYFLQVSAASIYEKAANNTSQREVVTPSVRGMILDDEGRPLAANKTTLVISVDRSAIDRAKDKGTATLHRLASLLAKPYSEIYGRTRLCGEPDAPKWPECWDGSPFQPIPVTDTASTQMALQILEHQSDYPGVSAQVTAVRYYPEPDGAKASHVIGWLQPVTAEELKAQQKDPSAEAHLQGTDLVGRFGLEKVYDDVLRGTPGIKTVTVDRRNQVIGTVSEQDPIPGDYLVTNIDAKVQKAVEDALAATVKRARTEGDPNKHGAKYKADFAAAVVLNAKTGGVVAAASYPTYDPNVWKNGHISVADQQALFGPQKLAMSHAWQDALAPGSTFKLVSALAAEKAGYPLTGRYPCPSSYNVGGQAKRNYESESISGTPTLRESIQLSCDTVFYKFAYETWLREGGKDAPIDTPDVFAQMARSFGMGSETGVDLPGETAGRIPDRKWKYEYWKETRDSNCAAAKRGYPETRKTDPARADFLTKLATENCEEAGSIYRGGDAANFVIGQGDVLVSPLQLARAYAAIANGGKLLQPQVAKAVIRPDGTVVKEFAPKVVAKLPISEASRKWMVDTFIAVSTQHPGTAVNTWKRSNFPIDQIVIGAKTGSAEVQGKQSTSWFASFAPANDPQYVVVMMTSQGGTGSGTSGWGVEKIYEALYGVHDGTVTPAKAVLPVPPSGLPQITPQGDILPPKRLPWPVHGTK